MKEILDNKFLRKTEELRTRINNESIKWFEKMDQISQVLTPQSVVGQIPGTGWDYIEGWWMEKQLDELFPGWSREGTPAEVYNMYLIKAHVILEVPDEYLLLFGKVPAVRRFSASMLRMIKIKKGGTYGNPRDIVDVGNDMTSCETDAFKVAINRLCHIGDDVYHRVNKLKLTKEQESEFLKFVNKYPFMKPLLIKNLENGKINRTNFSSSIKKFQELAKKKLKEKGVN